MSATVPPGFRFHPTDEELVGYYLCKKVRSERFDLDVIRDVDSNKLEPWDLHELCRIDASQEAEEWYFFSHKDKKYPTGTRTNRATAAGFWKATGRDKPIYSTISSTYLRIGMRKTLVFYRGRAPHGQKTDWIMHEYRLELDSNSESTACPRDAEEGWVVCRVFKKQAHHQKEVMQVESIINTHNGDALSLNHALYEEEQPSSPKIPNLEYFNIGQKINQGSATSILDTLTLNYQKGGKFLHLPYLESSEEGMHPYASDMCQIKELSSSITNDCPQTEPKPLVNHYIMPNIDDHVEEDEQWGIFETLQKDINFSQYLGISIPNHVMENHAMIPINEQSSLHYDTKFISSSAFGYATHNLSLLHYTTSKHDLLELNNWIDLERQ